ncbi:HAMP domain-containing histidine kinase [Streptomyces sp. CHD11]|uniref:sensor histidine kinase n=1 Tax=Streptomyces sp. CHD11 TaxID=2741325 RepID=UPI001BFC0B59|nr:HAMP domain-containing sensor histidine kinase [Streptomyces sp. CHD11]MBT3153595.1 HAMP domain-containing histidine kinase [Streptomyces sp. CHD11]
MALRLRLPKGLRTRFAVAFLLAAAFGALLTAGLTFQQARSAILERTRNAALADLRTQLDSLAPDLALPPGADGLRSLAAQLDRAGEARNWQAAAAYREGPLMSGSASGGSGTPPVPDALRRAVEEEGAAVYQYVDHRGRPWLALGMPLAYADDPSGTGGADRLSGITAYAAFPLDEDRTDIDALVTAAQAGALAALLLALVPALLAARSVLRPVRRLRHGAERITAGELDTRIDADGRDELAALTRSFNTMAGTLERDDAELRRMEARARRFAADVAHELRTPLAAMAAVTEVLDEDASSGALPADTADAVRLISSETRTLARLVEDLMEISRFDAGAAQVHLEDVDLRTIVVKSLQVRGWDDDERVVARLPERVPVRVDPRRIDVVLANLVGNALRHGLPPVTVSVRARDGRAVLTVTDQGPGIPEDVLPHVFERFYKADTARARSQGSGLGLALGHENALLHDGTVTAANGPAGGAVFTLSLPLAGPSREPS